MGKVGELLADGEANSIARLIHFIVGCTIVIVSMGCGVLYSTYRNAENIERNAKAITQTTAQIQMLSIQVERVSTNHAALEGRTTRIENRLDR